MHRPLKLPECAFARVCAVSAVVWCGPNTFQIHRYNSPRLGLVHRLCARRTESVELTVCEEPTSRGRSKIDGGLK